MSALTRFRIYLVLIWFGFIIACGFPLGFTMYWWTFTIVCWLLSSTAIIIGGAIQDRWHRLKVRDVLHYKDWERI